MSSELRSDSPVEPARPLDLSTICLVGLLIFAAGIAAALLRTVISPLLIGLLLFFLVLPLVQSMDAYGIPRWLTYLLLSVTGIIVLFGVGRMVEIQGRDLQSRLPQYRQRAQQTLDRYATTLGLANREGKFDSESFNLGDAIPFTQEEVVKHALTATVELLEFSVMAIFYLLFALMESRSLEKRIQLSLSPDGASRFSSVFESIKTDMRSYLWLKTLVSAGLGLSTALLGRLFGLDFWLMWGCLMFLANYITYIGSMVALVPMVLVAFAQFDSAPAAAVLSVLLILNRLVWIDYAEMRYSGKYVNVSPLLVLLSVAFMGGLWGMVGMLLAVPLLTTCRILLDSFPESKFIARLIGDVE